jgi:hypothetical protein|tara:strand:+ start:8581 stop:8991 length:411 start_codon:yes stop_codon:yes gene_type:complete
MGFQLGRSSDNYAAGGTIKNKLSFGGIAGGGASVPGNPVKRVPLDGAYGLADKNGTIYLSDQIEPGSREERETLIHEMRHATDMKIGKLRYDDHKISYNGEDFPRETIKGRDMIYYEGQWVDAGGDLPWERDANAI